MLDGNNSSIHPTLDGWVYIDPIHGPLDGPLYTWAQYTPTNTNNPLKLIFKSTDHIFVKIKVWSSWVVYLNEKKKICAQSASTEIEAMHED